jgi:1,4-alpha-glucan branching enzyme
MLPFSHDEVVHLKKSMIDKMPGDVWQKFANLRVLYGYMFSHPGKKLMFMGSEFAQGREWTENYSLDWHLIYDGSPHLELQNWVRDLNHFYRNHPALYELDMSWEGFEWLEVHDSAQSVLAYARRGNHGELVIAVCNFTPVVRSGYRLGVPVQGVYREVLNSDNPEYGGSGVSNDFRLLSEEGQWRGQPHSIQITLPPLASIYLTVETEE